MAKRTVNSSPDRMQGCRKSQNSAGFSPAALRVMQKLSHTDQLFILKKGGDLFQNIGKRRFGIADDEALKHDFLKAVLGAPGEIFQPVFFCQLPGYLTQGRKADAEYMLRSRKEGG